MDNVVHRTRTMLGRCQVRLAGTLSFPLLYLLLVAAAPRAGEPIISFGPEAAMPGEIFSYGEYRHKLEHSPQVVFDGDRGIAVWHLVTGGADANWAYTMNGGATWNRGTQLDGIDPHDQFHGPPTIVADGDGRFRLVALYFMDSVFRTPDRYIGPLAFVPIRLEEDQATNGPWQSIPYQEGTWATQLLRSERLPGSGDVVMTYTYVTDSPAGHLNTQVFFASLRDSVWNQPIAISNLASQGGRPLAGPDGELYVVWKDVVAAKMVLRRSDDGGRSFGPEIVIGDVYDNETKVPGNYSSEDALYLPTDYCEPATLNFPSVAIDKSRGPNRGTLYAVWTDRLTGVIDPATRVVSEVEPNNVSAQATPIDVGVDITGRHVFSESGGGDGADLFAFVGAAGTTIWIDGMVTGGGGPYPKFGAPIAVSGCFDGSGSHKFTADKSFGISREQQQPPLVFTMPSDGRYELSIGSRYESYSYRMRVRRLNPGQGSVARDSRDVVLLASRDGGKTWSPKVLVNDDPPLFDNYLPEVEVDDLGVVHVTWFDRRNDRACGVDYDVFWTCSLDGGRSFLASRQVNDSTNVVGKPILNRPGGETSPNFGRFLNLSPGGSGGGIYASWPQAEPLVTWQDLYTTTDHDIHGRRIIVTPDVAVAELRAMANAWNVLLEWHVAAPDFVWKFEILRAGGPVGDRVVVGTVDGQSGTGGMFRFTDPVGGAGGEFQYQVRTILTDERALMSKPLTVSAAAVPAAPVVRPVAPNPSGSPVDFVIDSPAFNDATVCVFDARGAEVRVLHRGPLVVGTSRFTWDGRNGVGNPVPSGIYFATVITGETRHSRKFVRVTD